MVYVSGQKTRKQKTEKNISKNFHYFKVLLTF